MSVQPYKLRHLAKMEEVAEILRRNGSIMPEAHSEECLFALRYCGGVAREKAMKIIEAGFAEELAHERQLVASQLMKGRKE